MSGLRFSPRWALSPREWDIHVFWLEKSNTCPTRPEGTPKGKQQKHKEEHKRERNQEQQFFLPLRESSLYCTGKRLFMGEQTLYSSTEPPEGLMYSGQLNQLSNFRDHDHRPHSCIRFQLSCSLTWVGLIS